MKTITSWLGCPVYKNRSFAQSCSLKLSYFHVMEHFFRHFISQMCCTDVLSKVRKSSCSTFERAKHSPGWRQ